MKIAQFAALALSAAVAGAASAATEIVPSGYVFDKETDIGTYPYPDTGGTELTDGKYGRAGWALDLGGGNAAEWVGWTNDSPVTIEFDFGKVVTIGEVRVGSTQNRLDDVVLPNVRLLGDTGGGNFVSLGFLETPENAANNVPESDPSAHGFLTLSGLQFQSRYFRVVLTHSLDGPWTFTDEIDFYAPVPEPQTYALLGAGLLVVAAAARRRRG